MWRTDADDVMVYASEGLAALAGVSVDKLVGVSVLDGFPAATLAEFRPYYESARSSLQPVYYDRILVITPAGRETLQSGWLVPDVGSDGSFQGMLCTVSDVTFTRDAEDELLISRERWKTLVDLAPVGIYETDVNGDCMFVNSTWSEIAGLSLEQALGQGWVQGLHPDDRERIAAAWYDFATHGAPFDLEYRFMRPDGVVTWVRGSATP